MTFLNQIINGLQVGSIYALIALGYTMVYGIVKLINFAHGDIIMVGSYTAMVMMTMAGLPFVVALLVSMARDKLGLRVSRSVSQGDETGCRNCDSN